jgi:uncharacterized C2H2 Zn-finger protein
MTDIPDGDKWPRCLECGKVFKAVKNKDIDNMGHEYTWYKLIPDCEHGAETKGTV